MSDQRRGTGSPILARRPVIEALVRAVALGLAWIFAAMDRRTSRSGVPTNH